MCHDNVIVSAQVKVRHSHGWTPLLAPDGTQCMEPAPETAAPAAGTTTALPLNWVEQESKQYPGRTYYSNTETKEVTWDKPGLPVAGALPSTDVADGSEANQQGAQEGGLRGRPQLQLIPDKVGASPPPGLVKAEEHPSAADILAADATAAAAAAALGTQLELATADHASPPPPDAVRTVSVACQACTCAAEHDALLRRLLDRLQTPSTLVKHKTLVLMQVLLENCPAFKPAFERCGAAAALLEALVEYDVPDDPRLGDRPKLMVQDAVRMSLLHLPGC